jgi:hypothetical protein
MECFVVDMRSKNAYSSEIEPELAWKIWCANHVTTSLDHTCANHWNNSCKFLPAVKGLLYCGYSVVALRTELYL